MNEGALSQEDVDRLMQEAFDTPDGNDTGTGREEMPEENGHEPVKPDAAFDGGTEVYCFNALEIDTLGEIGNISMGSAATALYAILGRKVLITTPTVTVTNYKKLTENRKVPYFVVSVDYTEGFSGSNLFILQLADVKVITDIMMGGDGSNIEAEMDELHISAISEAMNQMMGAMSTSLATMFNTTVNISPPRSKIVKLTENEMEEIISEDTGNLVRIDFTLYIEGILQSSIMQLVPLSFSRSILDGLLNQDEKQQVQAVKTDVTETYVPKNHNPISARHTAPAKEPPAWNTAPAIQNPKTERVEKPMNAKSSSANYAQNSSGASPTNLVDVRPIKLANFDEPSNADESGNPAEIGIDLLLDVPLQVRVELGKCKKNIKDILELNLGSIVTLDRPAGEPVDVVVNGKVIAKGEVIVIEDNYGIRITEISSPTFRMRK